MQPTRIASRLKVNTSVADQDSGRRLGPEKPGQLPCRGKGGREHEAHRHEGNPGVFHAPDFRIRVVPMPRAIAARSWFATPNIGQMVETLPV